MKNDNHLKQQARDLEQMKFRVAQSQLPKREVEVFQKHQAEFWAKMGVRPDSDQRAPAQTWARKGVEGSQVKSPKQFQGKPANDNKPKKQPGNDNTKPAQQAKPAAQTAQSSPAKQFAQGGGGGARAAAPPSRGR